MADFGADAWQAGDLAECIDVQAFTVRRAGLLPTVSVGGNFLRLGMVYLVAGVSIDPDEQYQLLDLGLESGAKAAHRFRKVPPLAEDEPAELIVPLSRELAPAHG